MCGAVYEIRNWMTARFLWIIRRWSMRPRGYLHRDSPGIPVKTVGIIAVAVDLPPR